MKILIVEDNVDQAESLGMILKARGHRPLLAGGYYQAIGQVETHGADAAILDLRLPIINGRVLLQWLRDRPETMNIPVVISTGLPPEEAADLAGAANVRLLEKPYTVDALLAAFADMRMTL